MTCVTCYGQAQRNQTLQQIGEMWISSNQTRILWAHHI